MSNTPFITIFTPAYNRAHTLTRTYNSLCSQQNKNFIWLIIDDGSTDNTSELVSNWKKNDNGFVIEYLYQKNGGMHTAHNTAYRNIHTELNICIDSDDMLANNAIDLIWEKWNQCKCENYAGIIGLDADFNGNLIGSDLSSYSESTTLTDFYAHGGKGDKKLVYRTEIINKYPEYPVFDNEKYVALAYKYKLIDQDYNLAVLNEILCNVEYQVDGSSATMWKQYLKNPNGFAEWRKLCLKYPVSNKRHIIDCIHYISSCILAKKCFISKDLSLRTNILSVFLSSFGFIFSFIVKLKGSNKI